MPFQSTMVPSFWIESITFTRFRGLSTLEKSCGFNSNYARYILNIHNNFAVAFLKNNNTVDHVPREISAGGYFLQKIGSERTCIVSGVLQGETKTP